jgi:hypothetical protein
MGKLIDLTNQKFGKLTVIKRDKEKEKTIKGNYAYWFCQCDCGKTVSVRGTDLRKGSTTSCGCNKRKFIDLSGKRIGRLQILEPTSERKGTSVVWKCQCDCGNICYVSSSELTRTTKKCTMSCGCMKSKGESKIAILLTELNIKYEQQKTFNNCINPKTNGKLRFDFYLPEYNLLLEFDGSQHFKPQRFGGISEEQATLNFEKIKESDKYKNYWSKENNIPLIRIQYIDFDIIDKKYILERINNYEKYTIS